MSSRQRTMSLRSRNVPARYSPSLPELSSFDPLPAASALRPITLSKRSKNTADHSKKGATAHPSKRQKGQPRAITPAPPHTIAPGDQDDEPLVLHRSRGKQRAPPPVTSSATPPPATPLPAPVPSTSSPAPPISLSAMTSVLTFPSPNVPLTSADNNDENMPPPALRFQTFDRLSGQCRRSRFKGFNDAYEELVVWMTTGDNLQRTTLRAAGGKIADVYEEAAAAVRQKCPKRTDFTGKSARQAIDSIKNRVRIAYKATNRTGTGTTDGLTIEEQQEKLCPSFSMLWPLVNSLQDKEPKYVPKLKSTARLSPPPIAPLPLPRQPFSTLSCNTVPPLPLLPPRTTPLSDVADDQGMQLLHLTWTTITTFPFIHLKLHDTSPSMLQIRLLVETTTPHVV